MPFIGKLPDVGAFRLIDSITTSATDTYALQVEGLSYFPSSARNLIVSLNGVTQAPESAYTVSGSNIIFASALTASDVIDYILVIGESVDIGTPSDNTVGNAQLKSNLDFSGKTLTFSADQISGDAINGGTISSFASTGIDDNATSTAITIDASQNVGVGTASPSKTLHVVATEGTVPSSSGLGMISLIQNNSTTTSSSGIGILGGTGANSSVFFSDADDSDVGAIVYEHNNNAMAFKANAAERMRIDSSGNVIIGSGGLDVSGIGGSYKALNMRAGSGYPVLYGQTTATATNSVGLQLIGATSGASAGGAAEFLGIIQIAAESDSSTNAAGYMNFYTGNGSGSPIERMRIDSSGNLLVGTTSAPGVRGAFVSSTNQHALQAVTSTAAYASIVCDNGATSGTRFFTSFRINNSIVGNITSTGSTTVYGTTSDYRLKENVVNLDNGIDRLKQIPVYRFNFIADPDTTVDGFIAHEVQDVVPEAITGAKDGMTTEEYEVSPAVLDEEGNVVTEAVMGTREVPEYQGIDQSKLVPLLTAALQEAVAKIEDLESRLSALEAN